MKYSILCGLFCLGCCGSFQTAYADPVGQIPYTFTVINAPGSTSTNALGINNSGQIVGYYTDSAGTQHGFLDTNGNFTTLPFLPTGINNVGQIVGLSSNGLVLDTSGAITNIALPGFNGFPGYIGTRLAKINDLGQIVGNYIDQSFTERAFVYTTGTFTFLPMYVIDSSVTVQSINNAGQILVTITGAGLPGTWLYQNGQYLPIAPFGVDYAVGINNVGEIVTTNPPGVHIYDLNGASLGGFEFYTPDMAHGGTPFDVNDAGQIVGSDLLATPVPEPASLLLFAGGLVGLFAVTKRKRSRGGFSS
jgi:probable HAF family extracellular repeat protein